MHSSQKQLADSPLAPLWHAVRGAKHCSSIHLVPHFNPQHCVRDIQLHESSTYRLTLTSVPDPHAAPCSDTSGIKEKWRSGHDWWE